MGRQNFTTSETNTKQMKAKVPAVTSYELKNQASTMSDSADTSGNVVDFANVLLAKHEANMRAREIERLSNPSPASLFRKKTPSALKSAKEANPTETAVTVFTAE